MSATASVNVRARPAGLRSIAFEQLAVAAGQIAAGIGNLGFSLIAARLLAPDAFADVAAFLALYLVVHVPTASLSAATALDPTLARTMRRRALLTGLAAGAAIAAAALPLAGALNVPVTLIFALAAAAPAAGLLALERGRLYGLGLRRQATASMLAEPVVRLGAGVALGLALGATGVAVGVVLAGWTALAVAGLRRASHARAGAGAGAGAARTRPRTATAASTAAVLTFLGLAVVQNQDVLLANALLSGPEAGRFAVLSTLGGVAAFATTTIPLVLLPRTAAGQRGALGAALLAAATLGLGAVIVVALEPRRLVGALFGDRYADIAPLVGRYVLAMAVLGVARVLAAHAVATRRGRLAPVLVASAAVIHLVLLLTLGRSAEGLATATLLGTLVLLVATGAAVIRLPTRRAATTAEPAAAPAPSSPPASPPPSPAPSAGDPPAPATVAGEPNRRRTLLIVGGLMAVGLILRLLAGRGLWLDEATSVSQARMPFGAMLDQLRATDVHPPLHHAVLWVTIRALGHGELAVHVPSLAAGTALIGVLYLAGRELYDRRTGLAAASLGTVAPFLVWYSQEARMYAFFMLFATLAIWAQSRALRRGAPRDWLVYAVASAALVWTQYFAALVVVVQQIAFLVVALRPGLDRGARARLIAGWLGSAALIAAACFPLLGFAHAQFAANETAGKGFTKVPTQNSGTVDGLARPTVYGAITNGMWAVLGYHSDATMTRLAALWPLGMLGTLALLGRGRSRSTILLVACALGPMAALFAAGEIKPFVFEVRYFCAAVPIALLLVARAAITVPRRAAGRIAVVGLLAALLAGGVADQQLNSTNPRTYDFRQALGRIKSEARPGDVVLYSPQYLDTVIAYYGTGLDVRPIDRGMPRRHHGRVFLLASFLDKPQFAKATGDALVKLRHGRHETDRFTLPQIRVWEFSR